ncbi:hypothetical protein C2G38_2247178 [Gigaspora rosea]|uniref:Uncharacterized protein n=1 Tax=Gigaspora rosea TaxID=44941 RepID=A0A397V3J9_9GLOM|nr:hypothetical protein C2G38_2247178 [Gigaspora rosea]
MTLLYATNKNSLILEHVLWDKFEGPSLKYITLHDIHEYFNRKSAEWTIIEFLNECKEEIFRKKIDSYLKLLQTIVDLDPERKRKERTLKTGRKVEIVIYEFAKSLHRESYLHSFIINDADVETKSLFSSEEWKEITDLEVIDRPKLDLCHKELLIKYTVNDIKKIKITSF